MAQETFKRESTQFSPPAGFENYFSGKEDLTIVGYKDLLPNIKEIELGRGICKLEVFELAPMENMTRKMVLIQDKFGSKALIFVAQDTLIPEEYNPIYGPLAVIGGTGVYTTPEGKSPAEFALEHTLALALAMRYKTAIAGLRENFGLSGMKATIAMEPGEKGLSDWEKSSFLQGATGWLYSPDNFFRAMTGTDARQTEKTILDMAYGSAFAIPERKNIQICGTRESFDTPRACRFSLEATLDALNRRGLSPTFEGSTISIQGFGRIGHPALELVLERGAKTVYIADIKFANNGNEEDIKLYADLGKLQKKYPNTTVIIVDDIYNQKADIFMPCSSQEEQLNEQTLQTLHDSGVKTILAGANKILDQKNIWTLAKFAADLGILIPPEVLSNCGSVSMASLERVYQHLRETDEDYKKLSEEASEIKFREEFVKTFVRNNAEKMIQTLLEISKERNTDIYTAGEIWYLSLFGKATHVVDGILQERPL